MGNLSTFNLQFFKEKIGATVFYETGLGGGSGLIYASNFGFKTLISSEIDLNAILRFKNAYSEPLSKTSQVFLFHGNSFEVLNKTLPFINDHKSCIFWLDAHFPGETSGYAYEHETNLDIRLPLEFEIETIIRHRKDHKDIIIIDDMRIYERGNYEAKNLDEIGLGHLFKDNNKVVQLLSQKFNVHTCDIDTGFAICLPK